MADTWSECFSCWDNRRVGPMEEPTDEQWERLHVRTMDDPLVKDYTEYKWKEFWRNPWSWDNREGEKPFDWLSKDLDGFESLDAWDFSDDVAPEPTRKARLANTEEAQLLWPHMMNSVVVSPPPLAPSAWLDHRRPPAFPTSWHATSQQDTNKRARTDRWSSAATAGSSEPAVKEEPWVID